MKVDDIAQCIKVGLKRGNGWSFMLRHYLIGILMYIGYLVSLSTISSIQLRAWRYIYFGWYTYDSIFFIVHWKDLAPSFCDFQSMHHSLSLLCTGTWLAFGGDWTNLIVIPVTIWLTSDTWTYSLWIYRLFADLKVWRRLTAAESLRVEILAFCLERFQRVASYVFIFFVEERSPLVWLILGTGLLFDVLDGFFHIRIIRDRRSDE